MNNELLTYISIWLNLYIVHFGALLAGMFVLTIHSRGLPHMKELPDLFKTATILSAALSIFTSHSHHHFMLHLGGK